MTRPRKKPYSGRLIFDHFPKTAGQAINAWLTDVLGNGTVSPNLIAPHRQLLARGGTYPILSAHVLYDKGEGLDPRYQYATVLREPIDRALSWLHFVISNHTADDLPEIYKACSAFLETEGEQVHSALGAHIRNNSVAHFAEINGWNGSNEALVDAAFRAIESYDCVGVYERLNDFVASLATLIGIPAPVSLRQVNVTAVRPAADKISPKLRENLLGLNELDRALYERVSELVSERLSAGRPRPPKTSRWLRHETASPDRKGEHFKIHGLRSTPRSKAQVGAVIQFALRFELLRPVRRLQAGLHIFDDQKRWAFGVNNILLDQPFEMLEPGHYRIVHDLTADLPAGNYTVGFAFADVAEGAECDLFWQDETFSYQILPPAGSVGVGYSQCYAQMTLERGEAADPESKVDVSQVAA